MPAPRSYPAVTAVVAGLAWAHWTQQPPCDVFCHSRLAARAESAGNVAEYASHIRSVFGLAPSHPGVVYAMARAFALGGASDSAVAWLDRLGRMGDTRDPNADSVFRPARARPGYADARNRLLANRLPILDGGFDQKQIVFGVIRHIEGSPKTSDDGGGDAIEVGSR